MEVHWSGLSAVHGGLCCLHGGYLNGLERRLTQLLCALLVPWLLLDLDCWRLFLFLRPLDVLRDRPVSSSRLFGPTLGTKMVLISTLMAFFTKGWGTVLGGWDVPHLPHTLPLLLVRALARDPWPFLVKVLISLMVVDVATPPLELVSVEVFDGCLVLFCMLQEFFRKLLSPLELFVTLPTFLPQSV